jgi:hypothetical protein
MRLLSIFLTLGVLFFSGCATTKASYDYGAFREHHPKSILVLPPVNNSNDILATPAVFAQVALPLAESGYYVFPASLVQETFRQNGLENPNEMHAVSLEKLYEIFGADAVLYMSVEQYGASYMVISSDVVVKLKGELVDLRSGKSLWSGEAGASSAEGRSGGGDPIGMLISALINQVLHTINDDSFTYAGIANNRLLSAGSDGAILFGPRSKNFNNEGF